MEFCELLQKKKRLIKKLVSSKTAESKDFNQSVSSAEVDLELHSKNC